MSNYPDSWKPRKVDTASGWKNNAKILSDIVTFINDETYVEDENDLMEKMDIAFEWLKSKYNITEKLKP